MLAKIMRKITLVLMVLLMRFEPARRLCVHVSNIKPTSPLKYEIAIMKL